MKYRLLDVGELIQQGDECYCNEKWFKCPFPGEIINVEDHPHRRPATGAGWPEAIKTADRLPTKENGKVFWWSSRLHKWFVYDWDSYCISSPDIWTYWMPSYLPPPPPTPPLSPVEQAWEEQSKALANKGRQDAFRAGWAAALGATDGARAGAIEAARKGKE